MRIVVAGATGFIGRRFVAALTARGDDVVVLSRSGSPGAFGSNPRVTVKAWRPTASAQDWWKDVDGAGAVVNLAGEGVMARRWSPAHKAAILDSRVDGGRAFVAAIAAASTKPGVFVSASGVGYYGIASGEALVDESAAPGTDFLAQVCVRWEEEARKAEAHGVRIVALRIGVVLGDGGGALEQMVPAFRSFVGGPVGSGRQWMPWVHHADVVGLLLRAVDDTRCAGPVNVVAPGIVRNSEFSASIGRALHRPSWMPVPAFALRVLFGDAADVILTGQHVLPKRALELGYVFRFPTLDAAMQDAVKGSD